MKRLYFPDTNKKKCGVCGGIGEYFGRDPTLIRIVFIMMVILAFGFAILFIIPKRPDALQDRDQGTKDIRAMN